MINKLTNSINKPHATQLQGQAAVWAAASQLAMRGHVPCFPGVDFGFDIVLDNGIRLQVKSSRLRYHPNYPEGAYCFQFYQSYSALSATRIKDRRFRDYSKVADFFVLWGVDQNRFWILPCAQGKRSIWFGKSERPNPWLDVKKMREMRDAGMTQKEIAESLGTNQAVVSRNLRKEASWYSDSSQRKTATFEDRWDLLDVNKAVEQTLTAEETSLVAD